MLINIMSMEQHRYGTIIVVTHITDLWLHNCQSNLAYRHISKKTVTFNT